MKPKPIEYREKARELRARGMTLAEIGDALGVRSTTVGRWLDPERMARLREDAREYYQRKVYGS